MNKLRLHYVRLAGCPILDQLRIEEALLRADDRNWCLCNEGSPPAIVMGISGKPELLVDQDKMLRSPIPLIRRFSGGGTVVVDHSTLFLTFIMNSPEIDISCCPKKILEWTSLIYTPLLGHAGFAIRENDYALGNRKFGGNAQYLSKNRWLHHSTLLWDYDRERMEYLLHPPKMPAWRENRPHSHFLTTLKEAGVPRNHLTEKLENVLKGHFEVVEAPLDEVMQIVLRPHRKATSLL